MAQVAHELLNTDDAARWLSVSRREVQRLCQVGSLPHIRIGREYRFTEQGLRNWLAKCQNEPSSMGLHVVSSAPTGTVQEQIRWHLAELERLTALM